MSRHVHRLTITAAAVALVTALHTFTGAAPQNLTGSTLAPLQDAESLLDGVLQHFGGGGKRPVKAVLERVTVSEDTPRRLVVTVTYSGLAEATLSGEVRSADRRTLADIEAQPVTLTEPNGQATIAFELRGSLEREVRGQSASLRIVALQKGRGIPIVSRNYVLYKDWTANAGPGNVVLNVVAKPIGTSGRLGPQPDYAAPPKIAVPMGVMMGKPVATTRIASMTSMTTLARQRQVATAESQVATAALQKPSLTLKRIESFHFGVMAEDVQKGAQGPSAAPIELLEGLRTEDINLNPAQLFSIATSIYPDKNPSSGVFYYHPRSYHLEWTPENGHGMRILYGAATSDGAAGTVLMATRLQSGMDASEVQLATELLNAYRRRYPATVFTALRPLPLDKDGVDVSIGSVLGQYAIPKEKIAITALSDVLGEIEVSWVTDPVTKENLQLALMQDIGVNGDVSFVATGGALAPQVPIAIQIADRDSFGRGRWSRTEGYRNVTPYPIRLRYLHALIIDPRNNLPILYSWSLDNVEVPPRARVAWDATRVPAWIDAEAKRVWVDYSVVDSCDACDKQVLDGITGGVTSIAAEQITFHTITPLADTGGYEISAQVRSKYFDPRDRAELRKSIVLKSDGQDFVLKPIYNVSRPAGEPLFEYLLELAMPDGTIHTGTTWIPADNVRVLIGRSQLEQSLGKLPGRAP
jgi:hypothetical protein